MIAAAFCACSTLASPRELTEADSGGTLTAEVGERFMISLPSNPTTGYTWSFGAPYDENVVILSSDVFSNPEETGLAGTPGRRILTFSVVGPGKSGIRLRAKTWPHGSFTAVVEFKLDPEQKAEQTLLLDGDNWQGRTIQAVFLGLDRQNHLIARRKLSGGAAEVRTAAPLKTGRWHRAVLRFDQTTLSLFVNGKKAGEAALPAPALARTHSVPRLGTPFYGRIRLLEVTGAALEESETTSYSNRRNAP